MTQYTLKEVLLRASNVSLKFGDKVILKPTSIEVRDIVRPDVSQGQVVGLLGPSGIGKTQWSRIVAGLQTPTTGSVTVSDFTKDASGAQHVPVRPGIVGMVAQNYPLLMHRTVMGNLLVALEHSKFTSKDRRDKALEHLRIFGLEDKQDRYPAQLSGGQRQRIAIAQALLCSEHFIVMDEPFTGLDPLMKDTVCELINKVATLHEMNTIFVVAHDIAALATISDQLWLFGRDRDESGAFTPGATVRKQYNLVERGLAWTPNISSTPAFHDFLVEVKDQFRFL